MLEKRVQRDEGTGVHGARVCAYRLMDSTPVERLHGPLGGTWIIELDKTVVGSLIIKLLALTMSTELGVGLNSAA